MVSFHRQMRRLWLREGERSIFEPGMVFAVEPVELLFRLALLHPEIAIVWADSAYARNDLVAWAKKYLDITIKTVRRPPDAKGFVVLPRRWAVERGW